MTAKKFIECIRIAYPHDPLSSTMRVQITNYFYSQSPRTGFVEHGLRGCPGCSVGMVRIESTHVEKQKIIGVVPSPTMRDRI